MQKALVIKLIVLAIVFVVLLICLGAAAGLVNARAVRRQEAVEGVAASTGRAQLVSGPFLVIPYSRTRGSMVEREHLIVVPKTLRIEAKVRTEARARGIFETTVAISEQVLRGELVVPRVMGSTSVELGPPRLAVIVGDTRGIRSAPAIRWQGRDLVVEPGTAELGKTGISALLDAPLEAGSTVPFEVALSLAGTESVQWLPSAEDVTVTTSSEWPHPSFIGAFLPETREVSDSGFSARWSINRFASGVPGTWDLSTTPQVTALERQAFGVSLMEPVDVYALTERSTKYGVLFLVLTLGAFFLFELLARLRIHPMQYGLVGVAQTIFFVLLLALAEHVPFTLAYWSASLACVALITGYTSYVLRSFKRAWVFGTSLLGLYGVMNVLLLSEDHALLLGAGMLFGLLALVMFLTRRIDWYGVEVERPAS